MNMNSISGGGNGSSSGYNNQSQGSTITSSHHHPRSSSNDYENPKSNVMVGGMYMSAKAGKGANGGGNAISTGGNNVIVEMDAENNEDESYYLSQSPIRRGGVSHGYQRNIGLNNKSSALSNNPSTTFGQGVLNMNADI